MKFKLKIWHFISALWLLIILLQFSRLIEFAVLWFKYFLLCFDDFDGAITVLDFKLLDSMLALIFFIVIHLLFLSFKSKVKF